MSVVVAFTFDLLTVAAVAQADLNCRRTEDSLDRVVRMVQIFK